MSSAPSDCRQCGVCCFGSSDTYVRLTGDDWSRLAADAEHFAHFIGHRAFMRMEEGHCAALRRDTTAEGSPGFHCAIYARRPQVCRDLERGSPACEAERGRKANGTNLG